MDPSGLKLYSLDLWSSSFGEWPLYPFAIEEAKRDGAFSYSAQPEDNLLILNLLLDGELSYRCGDGSETVVGKGEAFVIASGVEYSFSSTSSRHYHKIVLEMKGQALPIFCALMQLDKPLHLKIAPAWRLEEKIRALGALLKKARDEDIPSIISGLHGILSILSLSVKGELEKHERLLMRAKARLENDISGALSISDLAAELGVCPSMLNKLFRRKLGISPMKYRIQHRLDMARHLLATSSLPIKEISARLGYANQLYFSNDFKSRFGASPRSFRKADK